MADHVIEIHTSDRQTYKRCRRKFGWSSTLRDNLVRLGPDYKAFFIGTGFHFALEDYWGYRRFDHPALAFGAYYDAQKPDDLPDEAEEALELATGMLMYYVDDWLVEHPEDYETLWLPNAQEGGNLVPQVEVEVAIRLNEILLEELHRRVGLLPGLKYLGPWEKVEEVINANEVVYVTTYDRVVIDRHDRIFGFDYKSAASFDELNLQTNPQAGAYDWSMDLFYSPAGFKPAGIIWPQHAKRVPKEPKVVYKGTPRESLSLDISQATTYRLYKKAIYEYHELPKKAPVPERYLGILAELGNMQDHDGDQFIRRDILRRNQEQREVEQEKIVQEVLEMLDPDLPLYPNFTKDCSWDCPFKVPCLAKDDGSDYEYILKTEYTPWQGYRDDWRKRVKYPQAKSEATTNSALTP